MCCPLSAKSPAPPLDVLGALSLYLYPVSTWARTFMISLGRLASIGTEEHRM